MNPPTPPKGIQQAVAFISRGDLANARAALESALRDAPGHPDILQLLGLVHRRAGRIDDALKCLRASLAANERQPNVHNNLAGALNETGNVEGAVGHYRRALELKPDYADAACNLAILLLETDPDEAKSLLELAIRTDPRHARAFEVLGLAHLNRGDPTAAVGAAKRATELDPKSHRAQHNLGQAEMAVRDYKAAEQAFGASLQLFPASDVSWIGLGNALVSQGRVKEAIPAFERAIQVNPANTDAHRLLNEMLWQAGEERRYLQSYPPAIVSRPSDAALRLAYGNELLRVIEPSLAIAELTIARQLAPANPMIDDALGRAMAMTRDFENAATHHRRAVAAKPGDAMLAQNYLETLLKAGNHEAALEFSREALRRFPEDQGVLAFHTTALQLAGDTAEHKRIADFDALPKIFRIDPPPGFADLHTFNAALAEELRNLHGTKNHPTDQTLRGGTQTMGALFDQPVPMVAKLRVQLEQAIAKYVADMPDDPLHPLFRRKAKSFVFSGSWSARLSAGGFHTNHFHPKGWISSAYYVTLPAPDAEKEPHAGWFKLGETNFQLGDREKVYRYIRPEVGHLILFPSYFWHGTVPFQSSNERLTVAFDVVPA